MDQKLIRETKDKDKKRVVGNVQNKFKKYNKKRLISKEHIKPKKKNLLRHTAHGIPTLN